MQAEYRKKRKNVALVSAGLFNTTNTRNVENEWGIVSKYEKTPIIQPFDYCTFPHFQHFKKWKTFLQANPKSVCCWNMEDA